jgi:toxin CcdB
MQHDVFLNPGHRFRGGFPYVVELQANVAEGNDRIVAPLVLTGGRSGRVDRLMPLVRLEGADYFLAIPLLGRLPRNRLRHPVGTIRAYRDDIVRAIDWLFTGI